MNGITVTIDTTPERAEELTRAAIAGEDFVILIPAAGLLRAVAAIAAEMIASPA